MTYLDETTQQIKASPIRAGYNAVSVRTASLSEEGILTLTLADSASMNIALSYLEKAPADLTVRLRELNGKLEWAPAAEESWQVLCASKVAKSVNILSLLCDATGYGAVTAPAEGGVTFVIAGNDIGVRARNWVREGYDHLTRLELHASGNNNNMMIKRFDEIPSTQEDSSIAVSTSTVFKYAGDEIPAINVNGTYIAAAHGYYLISAVPNTAGLCEDDIGAIFTRTSDNQQYTLVKVPSGTLWFCPFDEEAMKTGDFGKYAFGSRGLLKSGDVLTTKNNLTKKGNLTVSADAELKQFYIATNHVVQAAFLDGTVEVDLTKNGTYHADYVDFYERYDVIYLPTMLLYLQDNFGYNTNDDHHNDRIEDSYLTYTLTHRFHKNGSYTVYQRVEINADLRDVHYFGVMSGPLPDEQYIYAPGSTNVGTPQKQVNETVEALGDWRIRSYYHFTDAIGTKGFNVGYYPYFGIATDEEREAALGKKAGVAAGQWWNTRKMYPYLFMNQNMSAGDEISFIGYHVTTVKLDDEFFAVSWYFVGDDIYLSLHTDCAVAEKTVKLPNSDYLVGMTVTVDEASDSFHVLSDTITEEGITVETTGAGYVTVKLTRP